MARRCTSPNSDYSLLCEWRLELPARPQGPVLLARVWFPIALGTEASTDETEEFDLGRIHQCLYPFFSFGAENMFIEVKLIVIMSSQKKKKNQFVYSNKTILVH